MAETLYEDTVVKHCLSPAVRTNGTVNGTAIDLASSGGARRMMAVVQCGTITDGTHTVHVQDSDDGSTGWADIAAGQLQGSAPAVAATDDDKVFEVGITSCKRFVRIQVVTTGATTGGIFGGVVILGDTVQAPATHP